MLRNQPKAVLTPYFSKVRFYAAEDIVFDKNIISYLSMTDYSLKVRVHFATELLLLILTKNKPEHLIIEPLYVSQVIFEGLQNGDFIKSLCDHLQKHFRLYSSKFDVEILELEDLIKLTLKIPAIIVNDHWGKSLNTKGLGNNPIYYVDLIQMFNGISSEYKSKAQECITQRSLNQILDLIEDIELMLALVTKIQQWSRELLPQKIKEQILAFPNEYEVLKSTIHNQFIFVLSSTIDQYFSISQNIDDKKAVVPLIAECISKKIGFLDFLKYKVRQSYAEMRDTDYRIPVLLVSINDDFMLCLNNLQHAILVLNGVNDETQIHAKFNSLPWIIIEASHFNQSDFRQILFVQCLNNRRLNLHGFNSRNAQILTERFLKFQFLNFKQTTRNIDVGKASHSHNKISVLAPCIKALLCNLKERYPGFISSFDDYNQETGLISVNLFYSISITIDQYLTQKLISSYDASRNKIETSYKIAFLNTIKRALNKNSVDNKKICRIKIVFAADLQHPDLIKYLRDGLFASELQEIYTNMLLVFANGQVNTDNIAMTLVPNSFADFIPAEAQYTLITKNQNKSAFNSYKLY